MPCSKVEHDHLIRDLAMRENVLIVLVLGIACLAGAVFVDHYRATNCFGNVEALSDCQSLVIMLQCANVKNLQASDQPARVKELLDIWAQDEDLLGSGQRNSYQSYSFVGLEKQFTRADGTPVVACDRPFDNVPEPRIWNLYARQTMHAIGLSNGKTKLITPDEYRTLTQSDTVDFVTWFDRSSANAAE
jgi:hypothetical protein